ncbi:MAG TPA: hypothetical protein DCS15_01605 [Flavobacteriales bacterium]|jgi:hypothetical protein|nr:hypothetical protein [Flavobacteriales bacterium]
MTYVIGFGIFLLGFFGSLFCLSNVLLPMFYSLPRLREEKKKGSFKGSPSATPLIGFMLLWTGIFVLITFLNVYFLSEYIVPYFLGFALSTAGILKKLYDKSPDLEDDFKDRFKEHWK